MDKQGGQLTAQLNDSPPSRIAGVVDGLLTISRDQDGSISLHMAVGTDGLRSADLILWSVSLGAEYREGTHQDADRCCGRGRTPATSIPVLIGFRRASDNVR